MDRTKNRLNCFCSRRPLLAMYGRDNTGRLYIHVRVFKQQRVYADFVVLGGEVKINCRECLRWHRITFRQPGDGQARLEEVSPPEEVKQEVVRNDGVNAG